MKRFIVAYNWLCIEVADSVWLVHELGYDCLSLIYTSRLDHYIMAIIDGAEPNDLKYEIQYVLDEKGKSFIANSSYLRLGKRDGIEPENLSQFMEKLLSKEAYYEKYAKFFMFNPEFLDRISDTFEYSEYLFRWAKTSSLCEKDTLLKSLNLKMYKLDSLGEHLY